MNGYEKIVEQMRKSGKYYNPSVPEIGIVAEDGKIKIDSIELEKDDYLINCNLRLDDKETVYIHSSGTASGDYVTDSSHNSALKEYRDNILEPGDKVLVQKLNGHEQYVVIAKVVKPE